MPKLDPIFSTQPESSTDIEDVAQAGEAGQSVSFRQVVVSPDQHPMAKTDFKFFRLGQVVLPWGSPCISLWTRLSSRETREAERQASVHTHTHPAELCTPRPQKSHC